jgi:hypothetical protein
MDNGCLPIDRRAGGKDVTQGKVSKSDVEWSCAVPLEVKGGR